MIDPIPVHGSCSNSCSTMDNGYLLLNQVKIPHVNMLAKFSSVDPETNKYVKPASASLVYGTLTWVRSTIVLQSGGVLARGVTIATRYAAVRRQFQDRDAKEWESGENQVLNYVGRQTKLGPVGANQTPDHGPDQATTAASGNLCLTLHWPWHDGSVSREPEKDGSRRWQGSFHKSWSKSRGIVPKHGFACRSACHILRLEGFGEYHGR